MNEQFGDARLEELKLLSEIDRHGELEITPIAGPQRELVAFLVQERLVNDLAPAPGTISLRGLGLPGESQLERQLHATHIEILHRVLEGSTTKLRLSHRGRLRLSELKQALRAGREREPFGILWDVRHWERDVQIAILEAREGSPLALAYLDMNGLKQINDTHGHDAGDLALKTYFQSVASVLGDRGQAYRLSGGADEVVVALPNCDEQTAIQFFRVACVKLMTERLWPTDPSALLSIAIGVVGCSDPTESPAKLRLAADEEQKRAKRRSKETSPRPSVIAIKGKNDPIVIEHEPIAYPARIVGSYFVNSLNKKGIKFTVTNSGKDPLPPFKVGLFHPKLGSYFLFPSEKSGSLLPDQMREFRCPIVEEGGVPQWFPKFTHGMNGEPLSADDSAEFELQLVLEDSDKVLYGNKRIARGILALVRSAVKNGVDIGGTWYDWRELDNALPDE